MSGITLVVDDPKWRSHRGLQTRLKLAADAARKSAKLRGDFTILLTGDKALRALNRDFRGKDKPTNVLSFPALQPTGAGGPDDAPRMLGDIAIAYETTRREADDEQKPFDHHLSHLAIHGFLHLIGYDHETDHDADAMEGLEQEILAQLGIPDPYADPERMD